MLVWDDRSNNYPLPIAGVMGTHDNETHAFFKGSKVVCILCPRQGGTEDSYLQVNRCWSSAAAGRQSLCRQRQPGIAGIDGWSRHEALPVRVMRGGVATWAWGQHAG